jgi:hypothetical protein
MSHSRFMFTILATLDRWALLWTLDFAFDSAAMTALAGLSE